MIENPVNFCVKEEEFDAVRTVLLEHGAEWDELPSEGVFWSFNVKNVTPSIFADILRLLSDEDIDPKDIPIEFHTTH